MLPEVHFSQHVIYPLFSDGHSVDDAVRLPGLQVALDVRVCSSVVAPLMDTFSNRIPI